jgi:hypothetical protein
VPLIVTYEKRHVLVSTTYSKAALRVAADEAERMLGNVIASQWPRPQLPMLNMPAKNCLMCNQSALRPQLRLSKRRKLLHDVIFRDFIATAQAGALIVASRSAGSDA